MNSIGVIVSKRGYINIPAKLRKEMNIKCGTKILMSREDNKIILRPVPSFTDTLTGLTARSFGETAEEVHENLDEQRKDR